MFCSLPRPSPTFNLIHGLQSQHGYKQKFTSGTKILTGTEEMERRTLWKQSKTTLTELMALLWKSKLEYPGSFKKRND